MNATLTRLPDNLTRERRVIPNRPIYTQPLIKLGWRELWRPLAERALGGMLEFIAPANLTCDEVASFSERIPLSRPENSANAHILLNFERLLTPDISPLGMLIIALRHRLPSDCSITVQSPENEEARLFLDEIRFAQALSHLFAVTDSTTPISGSERKETLQVVVPLTWMRTDAPLLYQALPLFSRWQPSSGSMDPQVIREVRSTLRMIADNRPQDPVHAELLLGAVMSVHSSAESKLSCQHTLQPNLEQPLTVPHLEIYAGTTAINLDRLSVPTEPSTRNAETHRRFVSNATAAGGAQLYIIDRAIKSRRGILQIRSSRDVLIRDYYHTDGTEVRRAFPTAAPGVHFSVLLPHQPDTPIRGLPEFSGSALDVNFYKLSDGCEIMHRLSEIFSATPWDLTTNRVLILDAASLNLSIDKAAELVIDIARLGHPHRVAVIGLEFSDHDIEAICELSNATAEQLMLDGAYIQPIALIASTFRRTFWAATSPDLAEVLDGTRAPTPEEVSTLQSYDICRRDAAGQLSVDITGDRLYRACVTRFQAEIAANTRQSANTLFVPPSLELVPAWLDVPAILLSFPESYSAISCVVATHISDRHKHWFLKQPSLLCEQIIDDRFVRALSSRLNDGHHRSNAYQRVRPRDIESSRQLTVDRGRDVIIMVGVLSSGQTARRLLAQAIRQHYRVLGVIAFVDVRTTVNRDLILWETSFPVDSIQDGFAHASDSKPMRRLTFLDHSGRREHRSPARAKWSCKTNKAIRTLGEAGAVTIGHFTGAFDRHFSVYIDFRKILSDEQCLRTFVEPLEERILSWMPSDTMRSKLVIEYPHHSIRPDTPPDHFAKLIADRLQGCADVDYKLLPFDPRRQKYPSTVYIDYGSVTGDSIFSVVDACRNRGARKLLYIALFSQLDPKLERFVFNLREVAGLDGPMTVDVWFSASLPVHAFPQEQCPACNQLDTRSRWLEENFSASFELERRRLSVRSWLPADRQGTDPIVSMYGGHSDGKKAPAEALQRRRELVCAQESVRDAYWLLKRIEKRAITPRWLLSLLTLLISESHWLRLSPLSSTAIRLTLANQCLSIIQSGEFIGLARGDRAKCLIGLRMLSKSVFAQSFSLVIAHTNDDAGLESLVRYLCATILARDYVAGTGLAGVLAEQLTLTEATRKRHFGAVSDEAYLELENAYIRAAYLRACHDHSDAPLWEIYYKLSRKLEAFQEHRLSNPFKRASPGLLRDGVVTTASSQGAWIVISRWLLTEISPHIERLFPFLRKTHSLENCVEFDYLFANGCRELQAVTSEFQSLTSQDDLITSSPPLFERLLKVHNAIRMLLYTSPDGGLLIRGVSECSTAYSTLVGDLVNACKNKGLDLFDHSPQYRLTRLLLPSRFRAELMTNLLDNAIRHRASGFPLQLSVKLDPDQILTGKRIHVLTVETSGTKEPVRGVRSRPGPGGLSELQREAPRGITISERFRGGGHAPNRFSVIVRLPV